MEITFTENATSAAAPLVLPLDYGQIIDTRALELMRSHAMHALGGFTCSGKDQVYHFHEDFAFRHLLADLSPNALREYEQLDPAKDCFIIFDEPTTMTVDVEDRRVRVKARALLIKKGRGTKYTAIN